VTRPEDTWGSRLGLNPEEHLGKPVIGILNTWNELTPCHLHLRERAEQVKRGVWQAGGFPVEFPLAAPAETDLLLYRNLLAMAAEEILRSHRVDGVVLMGGCGETTPALLMGAASTCRRSSCRPVRCWTATGLARNTTAPPWVPRRR
jgi:dihydroxyacid dehydratase/phosphogluconate dehydratase